MHFFQTFAPNDPLKKINSIFSYVDKNLQLLNEIRFGHLQFSCKQIFFTKVTDKKFINVLTLKIHFGCKNANTFFP